MKYTPVIGLEIHVELKTKSKMFCQCSADYFGKEPNSNTCPVCLGMPGALPVPNKTAVEWTIKIAQALNCTINKTTKFDRKHYFYPDLPKGYQISQYDEPIAERGWLEITNLKSQETKRYGITRVHLEEDTGKLTHVDNDSLVDFNRSSVPLVEIVTEPDFDNAEDVKVFLEELHTIIRYLAVSDANMEEGSMRMEPNISLRKLQVTSYKLQNRNLPNYKVEVKNINSFNFAKRAIEYEIVRQAEILDRGETPPQETRGYNEDKGITYSQRSKENAHDYRYFPEPDIPPMSFTEEELEAIKRTIPELPSQKRARFAKAYQLKPMDIQFFINKSGASLAYENAIKDIQRDPELSLIPNINQGTANIVINKLSDNEFTPSKIVELARKKYLKKEIDMVQTKAMIENVILKNQKVVEQIKAGKTTAVMFLVGQVMKEMQGQADAKKVRDLLLKKLS